MHIYFANKLKKIGRVIKMFSAQGHENDGESHIGIKNVDKNYIYL